ncbi:MAG: hypothetical protein GDA49_01440 [Rhodospirillales bacterium]|nr:hypothetical protein [Rhodospirillales bacterium]
MLNAQQAAMKAMSWSGIEPRLDDMLTDPIVVAVMRRDGLTERNVRDALQRFVSPAPAFDPTSLPATVPTSSF